MSLRLLYNLLAARTTNLTASGSATIPAAVGSGNATVKEVHTASGSATLAALTASGNADVNAVVVTVSGETISHSVSNGNTARAAVAVNSVDGTMDKIEGTTTTQIDASTDWRIPNGSGAAYHVRFTKGILDPDPTYNPDSVTLGTWHALTQQYRLGYEESANDTQETGTITVAISDDGGSTTLDSGAYPCTATVGLPP